MAKNITTGSIVVEKDGAILWTVFGRDPGNDELVICRNNGKERLLHESKLDVMIQDQSSKTSKDD